MIKKSESLLKDIVEQLQLGNTLSSICRKKDYPGLTAVHRWMNQDSKFKEKILDARRIGAMTWLDNMQDLLDQEVEPSRVQWYRERLHHSRWMASKLISVFNDKVVNENIGDPIIKVIWQDDASTEGKEKDLARTSRGSDDNHDKTNDSKSIN